MQPVHVVEQENVGGADGTYSENEGGPLEECEFVRKDLVGDVV
jgi:hypothetical protein